MSKRTRRLWLLLLPPIALSAINLGAALVYTLPQSFRERRMSRELEQERRLVQESERRVAASRQRATILDQNAKDTAAFYKRLKGDPRSMFIETQDRLWRMAEESGLAPKTLTFEQSEVKGVPLARLRATMPLSGNYDQLLAFLERLEKLDQFVVVDEVRLRTHAERAQDLNVALSAYFHHDDQSGGAASASGRRRGRSR